MAEQTNPYLALLQQEEKGPSTAEILRMFANLVGGASAGIGQTGTWGGVAPGLMMGINANAQEADQAERRRLQKAEIGIRASKWDQEQKERADRAAAMARLGQALNVGPGGATGVTVPQMPQVAMGPGGDYDKRLQGLEGGANKGGMVFNELGSGAYGPYQFMPGTWADVRAKNPNLNLPADMTQATREQHDAAHGAFKGANAAMLQAAGLPATPENLYLAHRFGAGGALQVLRADPNKLLSEVLPLEWQRQNPDMRGQTVGGFTSLATERMGGRGVPYQVAANAPPTPYALVPPIGSTPLELGSTSQPAPLPGSLNDTRNFTAPVMPQPQWPAPQQQPQQPQQRPQVAQANDGGDGGDGTTGVVNDSVMGTGGQRPDDPNVVRAQYQPSAQGGPRVSAGPPIVPAPRPQDLPLAMRQQLTQFLSVPGVTPEEYLKVQQQMLGQYHQQIQTQAIEAWREQKAAQLHARGRSEKQIDAEIAKIEAEKLREYQKEEEERKNERERKEEAERHARDAAEREAAAERVRAEARAAEERRVAESRAAATGSPQSDYRILTEGTKSGQVDSVEYRAAWNRIKNTPVDIGGGQKMTPNMSAFRAPPTGQEPQSGPQQPPKMGEESKPLGEKSYTESQGKNYGFAVRIQNSLPELEEMLRGPDGKYSTKNLPTSTSRARMMSSYYPDSWLDDNTKKFRRLATDIVTGILRPESGASIPLGEYPQEYAKYIPQPGDSHEEIAAKLRAIKVVGRAIAEGSGRPLDTFGGVFNTPAPVTIDQQGRVIE